MRACDPGDIERLAILKNILYWLPGVYICADRHNTLEGLLEFAARQRKRRDAAQMKNEPTVTPISKGAKRGR